MKKLLAIGVLALAVPAHAATLVTYTPGVSSPTANTSIIENFDARAVGSSIGPNAFVYNTDISGVADRPAFNSLGNYGAVLANGVYTIALGSANIFSFVVGSVDMYNSLLLRYDDGTSQLFSGHQIKLGGMANGDQESMATNGRVSYSTGALDPTIVSATFRSGQNSFEFDNLAIRAVPEPSTWLMMLMGFAAVGFGMRRRQAAGTPAVA